MRANVLTEIDGAIGLLTLEASVKPMDIGKLAPSFSHLQKTDHHIQIYYLFFVILCLNRKRF